MALSHEEQKILDELEKSLGKPSRSSARLNAKAEPVARTNFALELVVGSLLAMAAIVLLVVASATHLVFIGVVAFVLMLAGLYLVSQNWSNRALRAKREPKPRKSDTDLPNKGFFQERWDQRNGDNS
jgi:undecaprenyl pyrophosphate phosphatase UppP